MGDLIYRLLLFINSSTDEGLNYTIAKTMLSNVKAVPNMSINKLADICYTSPAAISRFCRKLGYSSFSQFKSNAAISVVVHNHILYKPLDSIKAIDRESLFNATFLEVENSLKASKELFDLKIIDRVLELIYSSKDIVLFGTQYSQLMAQDLQFKFAYTGKLFKVPSDVQQQELLADSLTDSSLAVLISPTGRFTLYHECLWNKIKSSQAKLVVITHGSNPEYNEFANYLINFNNNSDCNYTLGSRYTLPLLTEYMFNRYISLYFN